MMKSQSRLDHILLISFLQHLTDQFIDEINSKTWIVVGKKFPNSSYVDHNPANLSSSFEVVSFIRFSVLSIGRL